MFISSLAAVKRLASPEYNKPERDPRGTRRPDFEEKLGQSLEDLKAEAFQRDPRKKIADFFTMGDSPPGWRELQLMCVHYCSMKTFFFFC